MPIRALREVILLDERVRNTSADLVRMSQELTDLRDRVSRIEGMLAVSMARPRESTPTRERRRLPGKVGSGELLPDGCRVRSRTTRALAVSK
jgi:hypothetical protein